MARKERRQHATREEAEETKRTILRVAQQLFMEYGYRAVSTRQLADACGLTQPALYHYFADKQDLYVAMVLDEVAKLRAALERIAGRQEGVEERLRRAVTYLLSNTQHDLAMMLHDIRHELSVERQAILDEAFQIGFIRPIATIFEDGLSQGLLRATEHGGISSHIATFLLLDMISPFTRPSVTVSSTAVSQQVLHRSSDAELASMLVRILLYGIAYPYKQDS